MTKTKIEWATDVWNVIVGCKQKSPGCYPCYAKFEANKARLQQFEQYQKVKDWDGTVAFVESALTKPFENKTPGIYFVNSMGDWLHPNVQPEWVYKVFAVMNICPWHKFILLTKYPENFHKYFDDPELHLKINRATSEILRNLGITQTLDRRGLNKFKKLKSIWAEASGMEKYEPNSLSDKLRFKFPFQNVMFGVSCENVKFLNLRLPYLSKIRDKVRYTCISAEPLLESLMPDLANWLRPIPNCNYGDKADGCCLHPEAPTPECHYHSCILNPSPDLKLVDLIIAGGQSNVGSEEAKPCHLPWLEEIVWCGEIYEIKVFIKQLGSNPRIIMPFGFKPKKSHDYDSLTNTIKFNIPKKGGDIELFPDKLKVRQYPWDKENPDNDML